MTSPFSIGRFPRARSARRLTSSLNTNRLLQLVGCLAFTVLHAAVTVAEPPPASLDAHAKRHSSAVAAAQRVLTGKADRASSADWTRLGDAQLRAGQIHAAVASFEKAIELSPETRPYLWQYGIALYFAGRHADGRDLFVQHRRVNPHDVENAAWHFLCAAKATNPEDARKILLPAPNDPRVPMNEILARLRGGDATKIRQAVERVENPMRRKDAEFYANLYLGLIDDAEGEKDESAKKWITAAAKTEASHYMADVARVYASLLQNGGSQDPAR